MTKSKESSKTTEAPDPPYNEYYPPTRAAIPHSYIRSIFMLQTGLLEVGFMLLISQPRTRTVRGFDLNSQVPWPLGACCDLSQRPQNSFRAQT